MKREELNTDKAFRDKLEGHSEVPPGHLWDGIQAQMTTLRRKKRIAYISRIAAAAVVVLAFLAGWYFNENSNELPKQTVQNEIIENKNQQTDTSAETSVSKSDTASRQPEEIEKDVLSGYAVKKQPDSNTFLAENASGEPSEDNVIMAERVHLKRLSKIDAKVFQNEASSGKMIQNVAESPSDLTKEEKHRIEENSQIMAAVSKSGNSWKMGLNFSPGYSSQVSNHTQSYAQNMTYNSSEGTGNIGGGISVQYKTSKRWSIESGVYYAQNGQKSGNSPGIFAFANSQNDYMDSPETADRQYFNTAVQVENNKLAMNSTAGVIQFEGLPKGAEIAANLETMANNSSTLLTNGEFSQVFDFVEIPLYLRYLVVDAAVDVELIGGVNAGLVVGNNAFINNEYGLQYVGKTQDISPVNFSGTVGVGLNYELGQHISLAVEPRLNYFLNSINNNPAVEYRPYRVGLFTGVYYAF